MNTRRWGPWSKAVAHSSGRVLALADLAGDHMKTMTHQQLFGSPTPKSIRNTKARIARARLIVAAARERAAEMAYSPPRQSPTRESQRRRLAQLQSLSRSWRGL